jgi:hypothetical protein
MKEPRIFLIDIWGYCQTSSVFLGVGFYPVQINCCTNYIFFATNQIAMTKVVDLQTYRTKSIEQRGFGPWQKRFAETYDSTTRLEDLSDTTLYYLAQPGELSSVAYYEVIMGVLDLGSAIKFYYLENSDQMLVVDLHLFLADQVRFEMMRRLKWVIGFEGIKYSILEMVQEFNRIKENCTGNPPKLAGSNSDYAEYNQLTTGDKEVFIRRMLQEALDAFKKRL